MHPSEPDPDTVVRTPLERILWPFADFMKLQASSGILLMICGVAALIWANSPYAAAYESLLATICTVGFGDALVIAKPLLLWINDGLMAVFFLLVGLEIKRELVTGELNTLRRAALPAAAALGGMAVPALIYAWFNKGLPTMPGWGIPMATDIAFSLGVLAILGKRAPLSLKIFLTAVAIVDDLGAVAVIAVFYTDTIHWNLLWASLGAWVLALWFGRIGGRHPSVFIVLGLIMWVCMLKSGVHATIAGVLLAFAIPGRQLPSESDPATETWEHTLHPWVSYLIMPIFALANAGVVIGGDFLGSLASPEALGIVIGLVLGKPIGITLFSLVAVKLNLASLPDGLSWGRLIGVGCLAGIGFTMSLFIAELAFKDPVYLNTAKAGIITASLISGLVGYTYLRLASGKTGPAHPVSPSPAPRPVAG